MARIKCPECNTLISDNASTCSHCGCPSSKYWRELHDAKEIDKCNRLGDEMREQKKYRAALKYYSVSAALDSTYAQVWLGNLYRDGLGIQKNLTEAKNWYAYAAERGNTDAIKELASLNNTTSCEDTSVNIHPSYDRDVPMPSKPKITKGILIYAVMLFCLVLWLVSLGGWDIIFNADVGPGVIVLSMPIIIYIVVSLFELYNYRLAHTNYPKYAARVKAAQAKKRSQQEAAQTQINAEYAAAIASQKRTEPWAIRYSTSPCPYCGHYKVRYAKWEDKKMSVAFWGVASSAIGKNYKCEYCNRMWE